MGALLIYTRRLTPHKFKHMKKKQVKTSKRMSLAKNKIEKGKEYPIEEAISLVKETSQVKFDATIELHARLGIDPKKGDQQIRGTVVFPNGFGKAKKIAVFTSDERAAKEAGADLVGNEELIKEIKNTEKINFDIAVATPDMMPKLAQIAKVLGPKGLMPSPKNETVTTNIKKTIDELKKGKLTYKNDDTANLHQAIGKASWEAGKIKENYDAFMDILKKAKPQTSKGEFIKALYLTSTMGPSVKLER